MTVSIRHLLPLSSETQWSDFLAALFETDPQTGSRALVVPAAAGLTVTRESRMAGRDRIDLLVTAGEDVVAAVEVKMLSGLGVTQLQRYEDHLPTARDLIVVHPRRLAIDVHANPRWRALAWEDLLDVFACSPNRWVAESAAAARAHLESKMPMVDADTPWGVLPTGGVFDLELRARASWVFSNLRLTPPVDHDLVESGSGGSWVNRMHVETGVSDHWAIAEVEERLTSRDYPKSNRVDAHGRQPIGPSILVGLTQENITTSEGFDWDYLYDAWQLMADFRQDWVTNSANPRAPHDRAAWERLVERNAPKYLGIGFGNAQTKISGACLFGARIQLERTTTLLDVVDTMQSVAGLLIRISDLRPGEPE